MQKSNIIKIIREKLQPKQFYTRINILDIINKEIKNGKQSEVKKITPIYLSGILQNLKNEKIMIYNKNAGMWFLDNPLPIKQNSSQEESINNEKLIINKFKKMIETSVKDILIDSLSNHYDELIIKTVQKVVLKEFKENIKPAIIDHIQDKVSEEITARLSTDRIKSLFIQHNENIIKNIVKIEKNNKKLKNKFDRFLTILETTITSTLNN